MSTNGINTAEDADMTDCDGEKVVTMMDVLQEQEEFEEDANAVLGASDDKNCTYVKGYIKRQAIYACLTCCPEAKDDSSKRAGVCLACSLNCHENHELVELYTKRNFRCDCGNPKFGSHPCQYVQNKPDLNEENNYNQNFSGLYCTCKRPYPDPEYTEEDEMIQCIICEDWLHASHLEAMIPANEQYSEMVCKGCMENNEFLHDYAHLAVNNESGDIDIVNVSSIEIAAINDTTVRVQDQPMPDRIEFSDSKDKEKQNEMDFDMSDKIKANDILYKDEPCNKESVIEESTVLIVKADDPVDKTEDNNQIVEYKITSDQKVNKITDEPVEKQPLESENKMEDIVSNSETEANTINPDEINNTIKPPEPENLKEENTNEHQKMTDESTIISDIVPATEIMSESPEVFAPPQKASEQTELNIILNKVYKTSNDASGSADTDKKESSEEFNNTISTTSVSEMESGEHKTEKAIAAMETVVENDNNTGSDSKEEHTENESAHKQKEEVMCNEIIRESNDKDIISNISVQDDYETNSKEIGSDIYNDKEVENSVNNVNELNSSETNSTEVRYDMNDKKVDISESNGPEVSNNLKNKEADISRNTEVASDVDNKEIVSSSEINSEVGNDVNDKTINEVNRSDKKNKEVGIGYTGDEGIEMNELKTDNKQVHQNGTSEHSPTNNDHSEDSHTGTIKQENKRKISCEHSDSEEVTSKKLKLEETKSCSRPKAVKKRYRGATFWPANFRQKLCTCNECISMYKDLSVLFLIDPEDTVTAYETLGKERIDGTAVSQYEKGLEALSSLDRIQQINALTEYNKMRDKLLDFLKSFKDRKEIVKEEDIKAFFAGMKPKREPDGVYFCR